MEKRRNESDTFWLSSQSGFTFDEKLSQVDDLPFHNVFENPELLTPYVGLTEAAESTNSDKFSLSNVSESSSTLSPSSLGVASISSDVCHKIQSVSIISEPQETINKMILNYDYSLVSYKKLSEKSALLKEAIKSYDGNIILEVILFLKDTLKKSIFQRELVAYPDAANVYLAYLEENHEVDELVNTLLLLNRTEDAAIFMYENAVSVENPERKLNKIENCLSSHFEPGAVNHFFQQSVEEHKALLYEQLPLKKESFSPEKLMIFEELCGKQSVVGMSVLCTIIFCYLFYQEDEIKFSLAEKIKKKFNLSKKQFTWAAVRALAVSYKWQDIEGLFFSKNWMSGWKFQSCIPVSKVLEVLFKANAPIDVMCKYISYVDNEEKKLDLASQYECHTVAIQIFKNNKDRQGLVKYQSSLDPHSMDFLYALKVLNDPAVKWKN